jgi:molybdopterin synthase sulfur carrier subunit
MPSKRLYLIGNPIGGINVNIKVRYFASIREVLRIEEEKIEIRDGATVKDLIFELKKRHEFLSAKEQLLIAVNGSFAQPATIIKPGDEIALFPPVSGG